MARTCDGLQGLHLFDPILGIQNEWVQSFQFEALSQLKILLNNRRYKSLITAAEADFAIKVERYIVLDTNQMTIPVTVVVSKRVKPEFSSEYMVWQQEVNEVMKSFPGFLGFDITKPIAGLQDEWVIVFRFDSNKNLNHWLCSDECQYWMRKGKGFLEVVSIKRINHGFEDWLTNARGKESAGLPAQWKMAMLILLMLYPTVMVTAVWVDPLLKSWPIAYSTFLINAIIVSVLTWVAMPAITRVYNFWLSNKAGKVLVVNLLGALPVVLIYILLAFLFNFFIK